MAKQNTQSIAQDATTATADTQRRIKLLKPHGHAGRDYPAGSEVTMDPDSAQWLIDIGSAAALTTDH